MNNDLDLMHADTLWPWPCRYWCATPGREVPDHLRVVPVRCLPTSPQCGRLAQG